MMSTELFRSVTKTAVSYLVCLSLKILKISKGVTKSHRSKTIAKWKGTKRTNNYLPSAQQKTKKWAIRTPPPQKTGAKSCYTGHISSSCSTGGTRCVTIVANSVNREKMGCDWNKRNISVVILEKKQKSRQTEMYISRISLCDLLINSFNRYKHTGRDRSYEVRDPVLYSVKHAVWCVYLNSRE